MPQNPQMSVKSSFSAFFYIILAVFWTQIQGQNWANLTEKLPCGKSSPILGLQYGLRSVHDLKEAGFDAAEASKSCCDYKNHQDLKFE